MQDNLRTSERIAPRTLLHNALPIDVLAAPEARAALAGSIPVSIWHIGGAPVAKGGLH